jgi:hypothetical protein
MHRCNTDLCFIYCWMHMCNTDLCGGFFTDWLNHLNQLTNLATCIAWDKQVLYLPLNYRFWLTYRFWLMIVCTRYIFMKFSFIVTATCIVTANIVSSARRAATPYLASTHIRYNWVDELAINKDNIASTCHTSHDRLDQCRSKTKLA